jgi:hypothetical protein
MTIIILLAITFGLGFAYCNIINSNKIYPSQSGIYSDYIKRIGVFQDGTKPPSYAEHLCKSDFTVHVSKLGKFSGDQNNYDHVIYTCPKCKKQHELVFKHGDVIKCKHCKLIAQTHGNGLDVWEPFILN